MCKVQDSRGASIGKEKGNGEGPNGKAEDCSGCNQTKAQVEVK